MSEVGNGGGARDADMPAASEGRGRLRKRRKVSYLTLNKIEKVDYKDLSILKRFLNDRGKMLSARQTGATAKQQRMISRAIRRARELALLPYVVGDFTQDRRDIVGRPGRGQRSAPQADAPAEEAKATATAAEATPADTPAETPNESAPEAQVESSEPAQAAESSASS
jgi:small subunit ribosomal protein S18